MNREAAEAMLNELHGARWTEDRGNSQRVHRLTVETRSDGVRASWFGRVADGRDESTALAALLRREFAGAAEAMRAARREARRLREAAKRASALEAWADKVDGVVSRYVGAIPEEPLLEDMEDE